MFDRLLTAEPSRPVFIVSAQDHHVIPQRRPRMRGVWLVRSSDAVTKIPDAGCGPSSNERRELHLKSGRHVSVRGDNAHTQRPRKCARVVLVAADGWRAGPGFAVNVSGARVGGVARSRQGEPALKCEELASCGSREMFPTPLAGCGVVQ